MVDYLSFFSHQIFLPGDLIDKPGGAGQKNDPITQKNKDVSHACLVFKFKLSRKFYENLTRRRDAVNGRDVVDGTDEIGGSAFLQSIILRSEKMKKGCPPKEPPWPTHIVLVGHGGFALKVIEAFGLLQSKGAVPVSGQT